MPSVFRFPSRPFIAMAAAAVLLAGTGCAQLPTQVERPVSRAMAPSEDTPLATLVRERRAAQGARAESGFVLLSTPQSAYGSRLALVDAARRTLDLQYYAIHADASTGRLLGAVRAAARRGVRVRILLDDFHTTGRNALVMGLAFEPNIEMRMFNPLAGARGSSLGRMLNVVSDFDRLQQRMHNKLFIADNVMGVAGGRNLGDAYFGIAEGSNFVDLDVLAAGPVVREMSASFDRYWNNDLAYPVQSLVSREELRDIRGTTPAPDDSHDERRDAGGAPPVPAPSPTRGGSDGSPGLPDGEPRPNPAGPSATQRAAAWDQQPIDLAQAAFVWAPAVLLADQPAKIAADPDSGDATGPVGSAGPADAANAAGGAGRAGDAGATANAANSANPGNPANAASAASAETGETVVDGLLHLIGQARRELVVITPYFVPGPDMKAAFAQARSRGVRVRILTNSLASNDAPIAHVGYARHREELLAMGVELYEMRSELAGVGRAFGTLGSGVSGSGSVGGSGAGASRSMLHSKALVMDGRLIVVGSMNLDLRSQLHNTEVALAIRSAQLSGMATTQIDAFLRKGAWRVEREGAGLVWRAPADSGLADTRTEPDTSLALRLLLKVAGPLAPDELL
jgi:putative cardiolipin synthase